MSEVKKLTQEEIDTIKDLQTKYNQTVFELGGLESQLMLLQKQFAIINSEKQKLSDKMDEINDKEKALIESLQTKYGAGNINIETGEISPL